MLRLRLLLRAHEDGSRLVSQQGVDRNALHQDGALLRMRALPGAGHGLQDGAQADHLPGVLLPVCAAADHADLYRHGYQVRALPVYAHGRQVCAVPGDRHLLPHGAPHRRQAGTLLHALLHPVRHALLQCLLQEVPSLPLKARRRRDPVRLAHEERWMASPRVLLLFQQGGQFLQVLSIVPHSTRHSGQSLWISQMLHFERIIPLLFSGRMVTIVCRSERCLMGEIV
jgi:hypothetical protein